jgi:hypothetical protein
MPSNIALEPSSKPPRVVLTTHHLVKVAALVMMTIDHMGAYIYPDDLWWRAFGRIMVPVWFFLVGHALSYRTPRDIFLWAAVLTLINPFLGSAALPVNALVTIICCQMLLMQVEHRDWLARYPWTLIVGCVVFWMPSYALMEYGSLGFLYALMGYAVRSGKVHTVGGYAVTIAALAGFIAVMCGAIAFSTSQMLFVIFGTTLVTVALVHFTHQQVSITWMPKWGQRSVLFMSRHSLQYYVVHRVILQAIGMLTGVLNPALRWF